MNLSTLIFVLATTLFSGNLLAQNNLNDLSVVAFSTQNATTIISDKGYEKTAEYSISQIKDHLANKFSYPATMRMYDIEGTSTVSFTLSKDGTIQDIVILESLGREFDYEIKLVLNRLKNITPVKVNGKAISQKVVLPIQFEL